MNITTYLILSFYIMFTMCQNPDQEDQKIEKEYNIELSYKIQKFEDEYIYNPQQISCQGECIEFLMNFPNNTGWCNGVAYSGWTSSFGSPTTSPNNVWMWATQKFGEGVNLRYGFIRGQQYCMQTTLSTFVYNNLTPPDDSTANIYLTLNPVYQSPLCTHQNPSGAGVTQEIMNRNYSTLPSGTATYTKIFTADRSFQNIWFYPENPERPYVSMAVRKVRLCKFNPCDKVKVSFRYRARCSVVKFTPIVFANGGTIIGYSWKFGDDNDSNESHPVHDYNSSGVFTVVLLVHIEHGNRCCTKIVKRIIRVRTCHPCTKVHTVFATWKNEGGYVKFEPSIAHNYLYHYKWVFSDGTTYNTRYVLKPSGSVWWGRLTVYYAGIDDSANQNCCKRTVWFRYSQLSLAAPEESSNIEFLDTIKEK